MGHFLIAFPLLTIQMRKSGTHYGEITCSNVALGAHVLRSLLHALRPLLGVTTPNLKKVR